MIIEAITQAPAEWNADLLVLISDSNTKLFDLQDETLENKAEELRAAYEAGNIEGEYIFEPRSNENIKTVAVFSTTAGKGISLDENIKTCAFNAVKYAARTGRKNIIIAMNSPEGTAACEKAAEGVHMAVWNFDKYKKDRKDKFADTTIKIAVSDNEIGQAGLREAEILAEAVNMARELASEPGDVVTPEKLAELGGKISEEFGYEFQLWDENRLEQDGFVGHLKVGSGSVLPPRMFAMTYTPEQPTDVHLVLVGKGLTFDSGGISIKPAAHMDEMKGDMAGAAAVLATMYAIGTFKPDIKITGIVTSAENMPGGQAMRPGDIIVYKNGVSVQVDNTDAEGRLVLADGLILAGELGATHVIDIATLTGGCARALGELFTGIMGTKRKFMDAITRAGGNQGESFWKLPLPIEYREMIKAQYADITNSAGPMAAALTAGLFLKEFAPANAAWAHLDIAGSSWREKPWKYYSAGPIGVGVRTLTELARCWSEFIG